MTGPSSGARGPAGTCPGPERLASLLDKQSGATPAVDQARPGPGDLVGEDLPLHFERVEPGQLFFTGVIGPLHVSREASDLAEPGWDVTMTLVRQRGRWKILQVGTVYPH